MKKIKKINWKLKKKIKKIKNPINHHKKLKIKIMINYFFIYNIGFILKIITISILVMFYLIIYI